MTDVKIQLRGAPWRLLEVLRKHRSTGKRTTFEVLIEGCAGGGKTFGLTAALFFLGEHYPGIRILVMRVVKADLATTFQKVLEDDVVPAGHPMLRRKQSRVQRRSYNFHNGPDRRNPTVGATIIQLGGMDDVMRHRGTDYDIIYFLELVELGDEGEWSEFLRPLRSWRSGIPFQLLVADTNPDAPDHWVNQRFPLAHEVAVTEFEGAERRMFRLLSKHQDNPKLYDIEKKAWSDMGAAYMISLEALHGPRKPRLLRGEWVAAEGVVYENFRRVKHVRVIPDTSKLGIRWYAAAMDWGFRDPGCLLVGGMTSDGRCYVVAEIYRVEMGIEWWCERVAEVHKEFNLQRGVVDPSRPEVIEAFNRALRCDDTPVFIPADNQRASSGVGDMGGIDNVRDYLDDMEDGDPRVIILADRQRFGPDPVLSAKARPTNMVAEFGGYIYQRPRTAGTKLTNRAKELTDPTCVDHGMDTLRYLLKYVRHRTAPKKEEHIERRYKPEQIKMLKDLGQWPPKLPPN